VLGPDFGLDLGLDLGRFLRFTPMFGNANGMKCLALLVDGWVCEVIWPWVAGSAAALHRTPWCTPWGRPVKGLVTLGLTEIPIDPGALDRFSRTISSGRRGPLA